MTGATLTALAACLLALGCLPELADECAGRADCDDGMVCVGGVCLLSSRDLGPSPDVGSTRDGSDLDAAARDAADDLARPDPPRPDSGGRDGPASDATRPDGASPDADGVRPDGAVRDATDRDGPPVPDACVPRPEHCNGVDDDCDGRTDEDPDLLCGDVPFASPRCDDGACVVACDLGYVDLNADRQDGCERGCNDGPPRAARIYTTRWPGLEVAVGGDGIDVALAYVDDRGTLNIWRDGREGTRIDRAGHSRPMVTKVGDLWAAAARLERFDAAEVAVYLSGRGETRSVFVPAVGGGAPVLVPYGDGDGLGLALFFVSAALTAQYVDIPLDAGDGAVIEPACIGCDQAALMKTRPAGLVVDGRPAAVFFNAEAGELLSLRPSEDGVHSESVRAGFTPVGDLFGISRGGVTWVGGRGHDRDQAPVLFHAVVDDGGAIDDPQTRAPAGGGLSRNLEAPLVMLEGGPAQIYADAAGGPLRVDLVLDADHVESRLLSAPDAAFEGIAAFGGPALRLGTVQVTAQGRQVIYDAHECR